MGVAGSRERFLASRETIPEQPILSPTKRPDITTANINGLFKSHAYQKSIANRLSGAVRVPTVTYDGMGKPGVDERWNVFYEMAEYLERTFPLVYEKLKVETINEHALLYTWKGSNPDLKPLLFMGHSDVVPVADSALDRWTYPPFSGYYDGEFIWGRGSEDDKSNLIAILAAIDALLNVEFEPERTVILAVGYDEEGGFEEGLGARCLAEHLLKVYGKDGIELIFDEGVAGIEEHFGTLFATPATAEKGYLDVTVTINMPGGHSSTPRTIQQVVGYLAEIIKAVEGNPFASRLSPKNPTTIYLQTAAVHATNMPLELRDAILSSPSSNKVIEYMNGSLETRALIRTSTAVDVVHGGEKSNALPETASILVNHRIAVEESVQVVKDHYLRFLLPLVEKWSFDLKGFGTETRSDSTRSFGTITLTSDYDLEPSPVSDPCDPRFRWLTGTIRGVFGKEVIVAPVLLTGNTDTRWYWELSTQIYRMSPWRASLDPRGTNMHTVDERMPVAGLLEMVKFYHEFIRVVDEQGAGGEAEWIVVGG